MLETVQMMEDKETHLEHVRIIRQLLNVHGRLRCAAGVAADFVKVAIFVYFYLILCSKVYATVYAYKFLR